MAIFLGTLLQVMLFPRLAIVIRDWTAVLFEILGFRIQKFSTSNKIGLMFPEYANPTVVEIVHGALVPGCLGIPILTCYLTYFSFTSFYNRRIGLNQRFYKPLILKYLIITTWFLILRVLRYFLILLTFLCLWNTILWPFHYIIGHDIIGYLVEGIGILCFLIFVHYPSKS